MKPIKSRSVRTFPDGRDDLPTLANLKLKIVEDKQRRGNKSIDNYENKLSDNAFFGANKLK